MNNQTTITTKKMRSSIDLFRGLIAIFGDIILGYLIMMIFSKYMIGDNAIKIMPSIILTPVIISFTGLWLLFSKTLVISVIKFVTACIVCIFIIEVL